MVTELEFGNVMSDEENDVRRGDCLDALTIGEVCCLNELVSTSQYESATLR